MTMLKGVIDSILEFDEVKVEPGPIPNSAKVTLLTTGVSEATVKQKVLGWALGYQPIQIPIDIKVEEVQCGRVFCRYKVEVVVMPLKDWVHAKLREKGKEIEEYIPHVVRDFIAKHRPGIIDEIKETIEEILEEPVLLKKATEEKKE